MKAYGSALLGFLFLSGCTAFPSNISASGSRPFSDNFTNDRVLKKFWVLSEPNPGSFYRIGKDGLLLGASAKNGGSDLWSGTNFNASLLMQKVSPDSDWTIIAHFVFEPEIDFQAAGIVLTTQTHGFDSRSHFHRFELSYQNRQNGLGVASYTNGPIDPPYVPYSGKEIYLKLAKSGSTYRYSYSQSGENWQLVSVISDLAPYTYVGLDAVRQPWHDRVTLDSRPVFRSFRVLPR